MEHHWLHSRLFLNNSIFLLVNLKATRSMTEKPLFDQEDVNFSSGMAAFAAKQFSRAMQFLSPLADKGNLEAQHRLAIMYQNGLGVVRNEQLAFEWMLKAAQQGHALAQHGIGFMYMEGDCVEKNAQEAVKWFSLAAEQGLAGSQTTLALMYAEGHGVEKNPALAKKWYARAGFDKN